MIAGHLPFVRHPTMRRVVGALIRRRRASFRIFVETILDKPPHCAPVRRVVTNECVYRSPFFGNCPVNVSNNTQPSE
jgi:hypothetical protein